MVAPTTTDQWDEYLALISSGQLTVVDSWDIGLYYDATDTIVSSDDWADITTELTSGNGYTKKTITPSTQTTVQADGSDYEIDIDDQTWSSLTFDGTEADSDADAWFMTIDCQLSSDTSATTHLMAVGLISGGPYPMENYTSFTVQDAGVNFTQV